MSVCRLVFLLVRLSVRNAFVKIAKSNGKWLLFAYLCTYIACPTIHWSVCPLFCLSVHYSVHSYVCSHIVKIAKSIAKLSKSNGNQWYYSMDRNNINRRKKNIKKKRLHWKAALLFVQTYLAYLLFHCWCLEPNGWWC